MTDEKSPAAAGGTEPDATRRVMREFWDEKARENATYYISSYRPYGEQDPEEFWRWGEVLTERFLRESEIAFTGEERALEIGCGIGRMTAALARRFRWVEAIDVSPEMVARAREALASTPNVRVSEATGVDLAGFADGSFDFVFTYLVFQHVPDPEITKTYLREAGRVLRPGGWIHFQVNGEGGAPRGGGPAGGLARFVRGVIRGARRAVARTTGAERGRDAESSAAGPRGLDSPAWRGSSLSPEEIVSACRAGGLEVERTSGAGTQYTWVTARRSGDGRAPDAPDAPRGGPGTPTG